MKELSHLIQNPLDPYSTAHADKEWWRLAWASSAFLNVVLAVVVSVVYLQRPRIVQPPQYPGDVARVLDTRENAPIAEREAQLYFYNIIKLRYGWGSDIVHRSMEEYLGQCQPELRSLEEQGLEELIPVDPTVPRSPKKPRLAAWMEQHIDNTVIFPPLDNIHCRKAKGYAVWNCYMEAPVVIQRLFPPFLQPPPQVPMIFVAKLQEVTRTVKAPAGLSVGALQQTPKRKEGWPG